MIEASFPGDVVRLDGVREVVRAHCGISVFQWACVSCGVFLPTTFYAELHADLPGVHPIALICPIHGLEATAPS